MKHTFLLALITGILGISCSSTEVSDVDVKKSELENARAQMDELRVTISTLEKEIKALDPTFMVNNNAILVSVLNLNKKEFEHKVEVRGSVESRKNILISAQIGGKIVEVHVREGDKVKSGDLLVSLDADIILNSIAELRTALELATSVYNKQAKLWKDNIGTEIQYLQAKNNKESLERKLATAHSQLDQAIIKAPFNGAVDLVQAREGELATPGLPLVRIVNQDDMYIKADVSEKFIGKFSVGDKLEVFFPAQDKRILSSIASVSQVINAENRTFVVEASLSNQNFIIKPNQVVVLNMRDYYSKMRLWFLHD
ncbi:MAG: efflux RND transporter periplasmic adaptor subunit [Flammeovirgaceae bacterium]|nr:efflux RND transporter periplasmic adaptor subunit [Flammeovirgaceae bacterium]